MGIIINLQEERNKRQKKEEQALVTEMRASLNNDEVMKRYKIAQPTIEEREEKIRASIKRINKLMDELGGNKR